MTAKTKLTLAALFGFALLFTSVLPGCGRTFVFPRVERCVFDVDCPEGLRCVNQQCRTLESLDAGLRKRFGEPCDAGRECDSDLCVGGPVGAFCTRACDAADAGCPVPWACKSLVLAVASPDAGADAGLPGPRVNVCTVPQPLLCQGCASDLDCGASGADLCLSLDGGQFCGRDCTFDGCPALYACRAGSDGSKQCVPEARTCDCVTATIGLQKACRGERTAFGACAGTEKCQADGGFTACDAPPALEETCNGVDDDCNGKVDDFTPPTCTKTVGNVSCTGPQVCMASAGLVCAVRPPEAEVCNGQDDDCNGKVDEPFVDARGRYVTPQHCGTCGNDCSKAITHAVATTCDLSTDAPRCKAMQCAPGYFPWDDGRLCLELPDTLCHPCLADADCVGPGSRCITVDSQKICGRDCSASSAYPAGCPAGYSCSAVAGGANQCTPSTGTCSCRVSTLNSTRACTISTCKGFERCSLSGSGAAWATCDVATFNPEICDGRDNNCNGQVDEGYRNQATGKYETAANCGFCNNDCTKYFSPTLQHTTGVCDTAPALPSCGMGPCLTEVVGGTTFEWVNVNGLSSDGCECRRVQGNLTTDLPDRAPSTTSTASWVDQNCDGIDGVLGDAIFVWGGANAGGNGSRTAPFQTISQGVAAQLSQGKKYVLVAQGLYRENVRLFDGAQLFGGYASDFFKRDPALYVTQLVGVQPTATAVAALHAEALGSGALETVVSGFTILGWDVSTGAAESAAGQASVAVFLRNVGPRFVLQSNDVLAGRGGNGGRGSTGTQGFGRQASGALNGTRGVNSVFFNSGSCTVGNQRAGGVAGTNTTCGTANGGTGGAVICPVYTFAGNQGQQQQYSNATAGPRNGRGGWDWTFDTISGPGCNHVTESGWPSNIQQHDGEDGKQGADGSGGQGGAGAPTARRFGSVVNGQWSAAPPAAGGLSGLTAEGGGGGGAGGGVAKFAGQCQGWEIGATGGGGGAGGCGGSGGLAGGAGGASIAILISASTLSATGPTLLNNRIQRGNGGNGGDGGFGGAGGLGGAGGFGGLAERWSSSVGGKGGEGGNGGPGGGGGGGVGGPAFGVLGYNFDASSVSLANTFLSPATLFTGGSGGAGGSSPGANSSSGTAGANGASANTQTLTACTPGCSMGSTCDTNGVCVPN